MVAFWSGAMRRTARPWPHDIRGHALCGVERRGGRASWGEGVRAEVLGILIGSTRSVSLHRGSDDFHLPPRRTYRSSTHHTSTPTPDPAVHIHCTLGALNPQRARVGQCALISLPTPWPGPRVHAKSSRPLSTHRGASPAVATTLSLSSVLGTSMNLSIHAAEQDQHNAALRPAGVKHSAATPATSFHPPLGLTLHCTTHVEKAPKSDWRHWRLCRSIKIPNSLPRHLQPA